MTHSTLKNLSSRALQLATLFLATAPVTFGGEPSASDRNSPLMGEMVVVATREPALIGALQVTARREVPLIGSMVVTASSSAVVLVADLGEMTVTAERAPISVANLGEMTVTADRENVLVAHIGTMTVGAEREVTLARRYVIPVGHSFFELPDLITTPFVATPARTGKADPFSRVLPRK